eukprot:1029436-Rhodomonas_salina.2
MCAFADAETLPRIARDKSLEPTPLHPSTHGHALGTPLRARYAKSGTGIGVPRACYAKSGTDVGESVSGTGVLGW